MMLYNFQHFQVPCFDVYLSYSPTSSPSTSLFHAWTPIGLTRRVPAPLVFKRDNDVRSYSDYNEMQPSMAELFLMVPKKGPIIFKSALLIWVPSWIMWNTLRIINKFSCMHWDCTHFWFQFHITINNFQPPRGGFFFVFCFFGRMGKNPKKSLEGFEVATFELIESPSAPDPAWNIRGKSYQASAFWSRSPGLGNLWDNSAYWIYRCYKYLVPKQVSIVP